MKSFKYNNVMLLDDGELDNFVNEKIMENNGFAKNVYIYTRAKSALHFLEDLIAKRDVSAYPEVLFIDLNMPEMDGLEFLKELKKSSSDFIGSTRLIILTSSLNPKDKETVMAIDSNILFVSKPLTEEILDAIYKSEPNDSPVVV